MTDIQTSLLRLRVAHLNARAPTPFDLSPDADTRARIAKDLDLIGLTRLTFQGEIRAVPGDAWELTGHLSARVTQACVVSLKPIKSTIAVEVRRVYTPHFAVPDADEVEMPDDALEPLTQVIDVSAVMAEELALALPPYPRAEDAALDLPGEDAPRADTRRPFADLDKLLKPKG